MTTVRPSSPMPPMDSVTQVGSPENRASHYSGPGKGGWRPAGFPAAPRTSNVPKAGRPGAGHVPYRPENPSSGPSGPIHAPGGPWPVPESRDKLEVEVRTRRLGGTP